MRLCLENLDVAVNGHAILRSVNLTVRKGEIHSILGVNGTGKSSLAYTIMGLEGYRVTSGRILFEGEDITSLPVWERARRGITLAWQEPARFEGLTVRQYLALSRRSAANGLPPEEALLRVGLEPRRYLDRTVDQSLSGGERKRVELASVLAMMPKLVILDEPDSGIDALSIGFITDAIRTFARFGASVLLITHQEEVASVADRSSTMCNGTILKTGDPAEVARFFRLHCRACDHVNEPDEEVSPNA
jgi:Fe-S cluster assembly ATP-binding protein